MPSVRGKSRFRRDFFSVRFGAVGAVSVASPTDERNMDGTSQPQAP